MKKGQLKIGILTIGNELIEGMITDTNSPFIAREINLEGWQTSGLITVADDEQAIKNGLSYLMEISDALIVTGGLGPTADDITTEAIAKAFNLALSKNEKVLDEIKERFKKLHIRWTENNVKQAVFPYNSEIINNTIGTAWGFSLEINNKVMVVLPGVPAEARKMLTEGVIPLIRRKFQKAKSCNLKRTIKIFGLSEAKADEILSSVNLKVPGIQIASYPRFPEVHLVITSRGEDKGAVLQNIKYTENLIAQNLQKYIFGYDNDTMEEIVASLFWNKGLTLSVAESCTGGLVTDRLTNISGSSAFLNRGIVAYSNASKVEMLGVPSSIIQEFGAVSQESAISMAEGIRKSGKTDIGIATTGIAGPTGGTEIKPVGTVFIALTDGQKTVCSKFLFGWERRRIKEISSQWALEMLRRYLIGRKIDGQ